MDVGKPKMQTYVESLADKYEFEQAGEVEGLLWDHEDLAPLLIEARGQIARCFGPNASVALMVAHDPRGESEPKLLALIQTQLSVGEARKREDQFDEEWWLDHLPLARFRLNFCLRYV